MVEVSIPQGTKLRTGRAAPTSAGIVGLILKTFTPDKLFKTVWRTGRVVRKGFKFVKYGRKYLDEIGLALEKGLKADVDGSIIRISKNGDEVARVTNNVLTFKYTGFGGEITANPNKTTTLIGKWIDRVDGVGLKKINESGLTSSGRNIGGFNILSANTDIYKTDGEIWANVNEPWLYEAISNNDIIRNVSNPFDINNRFKKNEFDQFVDLNGLPISQTEVGTRGVLSFFGREVELLQSNGYVLNANNKTWVKR